MMGLVYITLSILLLGVVCYLYERKQRKKRPTLPEPESPDRPSAPAAECCGRHLVCEKEALLLDASRGIVYYDDEELDRYAGRPADAFTPEETREFEEVFYTLRPEDVTGWLHSLQRRGINLPDTLEAEAWLIVREQREQKASGGKLQTR